jgi:hypothetical protein
VRSAMCARVAPVAGGLRCPFAAGRCVRARISPSIRAVSWAQDEEREAVVT